MIQTLVILHLEMRTAKKYISMSADCLKHFRSKNVELKVKIAGGDGSGGG
jgi:hypothetical protein